MKRILSLWAVLLFFAVCLCGCRTYFGSDDIIKTEASPVAKQEQNNRLFCALEAKNGGIKVYLVEKYEVKEVQEVKSYLTGLEHYYAEFESENSCPLYVGEWPFDEYNSFCGELWDNKSFSNLWCNKGLKKTHQSLSKLPWALLYIPTWPISYPMMFLGGLTGAFMMDIGAWMGGLCIDGCVYAAQGMTWCGLFMWNGIVSPVHWFGARSFGFFRSWNLRKNKPGVLRMLSYMPFINLFCFAQTPPYLNDNILIKEQEFFEPELLRVEKINRTVEAERGIKGPVKISLQDASGKVLAHGSFTPDRRSSVNIYELGVKALANSSNDTVKFILVADSNGKQLTKEIDAGIFVSPQAAGDWQIFCNAKADIRSRISAWQRSHKFWRLSAENKETQRQILLKNGYGFCLE